MAKYSTPAWSNGTSPAINAANLLAIGRALEEAQWPYGVCSTGASTTAKTVTIGFSGTFSLYTGATVRVKFSNGNTASAPTLNVNSTGAVAIANYGSTPIGNLTAGQIVTLTYDGSRWVVSGIGYANGAARIVTGTYTGTGEYGSGSPNTLTFDFVPKLLFIVDGKASYTYMTLIIPGTYSYGMSTTGSSASTVNNVLNSASTHRMQTSLSGNTVSWYSKVSAGAQLNTADAVYSYVAIG